MALPPFTAAGPVDPPPAEVLNEARIIVQRIIPSPRGPYSRIRWYCNDGAILAPVAYACREHGGGRQHAEYSADRERLPALGWSVGTIFAPLTFESLLEQLPRAMRLSYVMRRYFSRVVCSIRAARRKVSSATSIWVIIRI